MNYARFPFVAGLCLIALAACSGPEKQNIRIESGSPLIRVICEVAVENSAFDSGVAVISKPTTTRHEFFVTDESKIRERLEKMGVGTKDRPCTHFEQERVSN